MKKVIKWIEIWLIWIAVVSAIALLVAKPIFSKCYNDFYTEVVADRNELYDQANILEDDFDEVYNMRNAEIINSEEPVVVLKNERFTLNLQFNQGRTEIMKVEEIRQFSTVFWILTSLLVATLLYIVYSIGKMKQGLHLFGRKKRARVE